jgi:hypothetical protein
MTTLEGLVRDGDLGAVAASPAPGDLAAAIGRSWPASTPRVAWRRHVAEAAT